MGSRFEDTIVARATPEGVGAVSVVRLSGPRARELLAAAVHFGRKPPWEQPRRMVVGRVRDGEGRTLDQVLLCFMPAPRSYTGEDMAEIHGHGGQAAVQAVIGRLLELGARPAEPGEFTRRAFENGRMSLDQAEGVARVVEAGSRAELVGAARALEGEIGERLGLLAEALEGALAGVEAGLEFPEEEDVARRARVDLAPCVGAVEALSSAVRRVGEGGKPRVVVAGRTNAGKSSIINKLSGKMTSLVTPQPGTTRDAVVTEVLVLGRRVELVDTAGREPGPGDEVPADLGPAGPADEAAVRLAREQASRADLVLWVASAEGYAAGAPVLQEIVRGLEWIRSLGRPGLGVLNKVDLLGPEEARAVSMGLDARGLGIPVSALTGEGLEALLGRVAAELEGLLGPVDGLPVSVRQAEALRRIRQALARASENQRAGASELLAEDLREAIAGVGLLRGQGLEPDVLERIFAAFCVGK